MTKSTAGRLIIAALVTMVTGQGCGNKGPRGKAGGGSVGEEASFVVGKIVSAVNLGEVGGQGAVVQSGKKETTAIGGAKIMSRDKVRVGDRGGAMILLGEKDQMALRASTVVQVQSEDEVTLERGEIWVQDGLSAEPGRLTVTSRDARVDLEGAHGSVRADDDGLRVALVSGRGRLLGEGTSTEIVAGQEMTLDNDGRVVLRPITDAGNLVAWTETLREVVRESTSDEEEGPSTGGIGTMAAKAPGSGHLLPFEVLSQDVTVRIQDRVAVTRIEQVFKNPTKQTVEGIYRFPVPAGARLTRYDMEIKGKLMQGEIVERARGRAIMKKVIDDFLYMMRDPALVEWEAGSTFKTRIFPIGPRAEKRIVMSYIQMLDGEAGRYRWVLPVASSGAEAARVPQFRVDARVTGAGGVPVVHTPLYESDTAEKGQVATVDFMARDFQAPVDFVIEVEHQERPEARLATYGAGEKVAPGEDEMLGSTLKKAASEDAGWEWFMVDVAPEVAIQGEDLAGEADWVILVDTSQSRTAMEMQVQQNLVTSMVGALSVRDRVKIMAYDVTARAMDEGWQEPSTVLLDQIDEFLGAIQPGGATNLEGALRAAAEAAADSPRARIILVGDGAATMGERRAAQLSRRAVSILEETGAPVTTIGVGSSVDALLMEEISRRTGGKFFMLSTGEDLLRAAVRVIATMRVPVLENVKVQFDGVEVKDVSPAHLPNLTVGAETSVTGRYRGTGKLDVKVTGYLSGKPFEQDVSFDVGAGKKANSFVPLMWAAGRIDDLTLSTDEDARDEVVRLSKAYSIPSRWTSFIVLENKKMYQEFGVKQTDDRLEWEGGEAIDYESLDEMEALDEMDQMDAEMELESVASKGDAPMAGASLKPKKAAAMAKSAPPAKKAKSAKPMMDLGFEDDILGMGGGGYHPVHTKCSSSTHTRITQLPPETGDARVLETLKKLEEDVDENPLHRLYRKRFVKYLIRLGELQEAAAQVQDWRSKDSADPTVLGYAGDLARLSGDVDEALRLYSGELDMNPERKKTLQSLALWMEARERWDLAHAFRTALHVIKPSDTGDILNMAIAASRAGRTEDAKNAALLLVEEGKDGELKLKKKVKLSVASKEALLRLAAGEKLPLGYEAPSLSDAGKARFTVELTWSGDADLDLWVATTSGLVLGGDKKDGGLIPSAKGSVGETFYMTGKDQGRYAIQVYCASGDCGNVAGKVKIRAHDSKKTIPFVIDDGQGVNLAEVKVYKSKKKCVSW